MQMKSIEELRASKALAEKERADNLRKSMSKISESVGKEAEEVKAILSASADKKNADHKAEMERDIRNAQEEAKQKVIAEYQQKHPEILKDDNKIHQSMKSLVERL